MRSLYFTFWHLVMTGSIEGASDSGCRSSLRAARAVKDDAFRAASRLRSELERPYSSPVIGRSWCGYVSAALAATKPLSGTALIATSAIEMYCGDTSMPMNLRPRARAATPLFPLPTNGSSTKSFGPVLSAMQRPGSGVGNWAQGPFLPLEVGNTLTSESLSAS